MNSTVDLSPLNFLLKATTKQAVEKCLSLVFASRNESSSLCIENLQVILGGEENITIEEATSLYDALLECITVSLYAGEVDALAALYEEKGSEVNPKLKSLVGQIVTAKLALWREASSLSRVSLPKLVDVDWAMHVKTASSEVTRMNVSNSSVLYSCYIYFLTICIICTSIYLYSNTQFPPFYVLYSF